MKFAVGDRVILNPVSERVIFHIGRAKKKRTLATVVEVIEAKDWRQTYGPRDAAVAGIPPENDAPCYRLRRDGKVSYDLWHESDLMPLDENKGMLIAADWLEARDEDECQVAARVLRREFS